jgi:hypothetical protein
MFFRSVVLCVTMVLEGCAHTEPEVCHQSYSYSLRDDGTIVYRANVLFSSGMVAEPYQEYAPTDANYQQTLANITRLFPDFVTRREVSGSRNVPCG